MDTKAWSDATHEERIEWLRDDIRALSEAHNRAVARLNALVDSLTRRIEALERSHRPT